MIDAEVIQEQGSDQDADMLITSGVCACFRCSGREDRIYYMIGRCWNCKTEPIVMLFRVGERATPLECPICGCREVRAERLATAGEIPAASVSQAPEDD